MSETRKLVDMFFARRFWRVTAAFFLLCLLCLPLLKEDGLQKWTATRPRPASWKISQGGSTVVISQKLGESGRQVQDGESRNTSNYKLILYWTTWREGLHLGKGWSQNREDVEWRKCKVTSCKSTDNKSLVQTADAVVVFVPQWARKGRMEADMVTFLKTGRPKKQRWVFMQHESPQNKWGERIQDPQLNSIFTWTMTYRRDSDIYHPYGHFERLKEKKSADFMDSLKERALSKTGVAAWLVSNCHAKSKREEFVRQLQEFLHVETFGRCKHFANHNASCDRLGFHKQREASEMCVSKISNNHKFYLTLENSICTDYASEKVFDKMKVDMIPIVLGGANYEKILPPHSFINVADFDSVKELADYLKYLNMNVTAYLEYFQWKIHYKVFTHVMGHHQKAFCKLCEKMHEDIDSAGEHAASRKHSDYSDITGWWWDKVVCLADWTKVLGTREENRGIESEQRNMIYEENLTLLDDLRARAPFKFVNFEEKQEIQ